MSEKLITRRNTLKTFGVMGAAATVLAGCKTAPKATEKTKATAFALVGDRFHNSDYIRSALGKTLVKEAGLTIDFTDETTLLNAENLQGYKMLIVFRDGMNWPDGYADPGSWYAGVTPGTIAYESVPPLPEVKMDPKAWITPEQGLAVRQFVENGGSAWFFHNNSNVSLYDENYRFTQGGAYTGHPEVRPFWIKIQNHDHPITQGVNDFLVTDEQHYMIYNKGEENVLARSEQKDLIPYTGYFEEKPVEQGPSCEAVWAYELGKGRVCFMAPGHMIGVMWNPEYVKMQHNAVKWLLRET